jgi:hypothetical protein
MPKTLKPAQRRKKLDAARRARRQQVAPVMREIRVAIPRPEPTERQIAEAAFYLHQQGAPGTDADRWLAAERQLRAA